MRIAVTGSSGLVGSAARGRLAEDGAEIIRVVRHKAQAPDELSWDPMTGETDTARWEGLDAVVHLAGDNISKGRWTAAKKERIRASRVVGTRNLARILTTLERPPQTLVTASAIGYYGSRGDELLDETSAPGDDFLANVCREWESASEAAEQAGIRVVRLRIGVVLASHGGALHAMLTPFRLGLGGRVGSGRQYWSWIAIDDLAKIIGTAVHDDRLRGAVNAVSPQAVTNAEFTRTLARVLHRPAILPMPTFAVKLIFGEMGDALLLASTRVSPAKLLAEGFEFQYPDLHQALTAILAPAAGEKGNEPRTERD